MIEIGLICIVAAIAWFALGVFGNVAFGVVLIKMGKLPKDELDPMLMVFMAVILGPLCFLIVICFLCVELLVVPIARWIAGLIEHLTLTIAGEEK